MTSRLFDLVIFDCDGVLIDSEIISAGLLAKELAKFEPTIDLDYVLTHFLGRAFPRVAAKFKTQFGVTLDDGFEQRYRNKLVEAFRGNLRAMPNVRDVIGDLAVPYCVATSSSPIRARKSLQIVELFEYFEDVLFTSSEVANGKPAPDLFLHVARKMRVDPLDCLVIEDSLPGIQAALAAGMTVWHFTGGSHLQRASAGLAEGVVPHRTFSDLNDFFRLNPLLKKQSQKKSKHHGRKIG